MSKLDISYLHPQLQPFAIPVSDLVQDPHNARKRDKRAMDALKASITAQGFRSIIIVQKNDKGELVIRAGNGRHQAMTELGYSHIPALIYEEGDDAAVAFAISDNRTAELAEWDFEELGKHLTALGENGIDLNSLGWTEAEHESLLVFSLDEEDDVPAPTQQTVAADPNYIPDYVPAKDFFVIKIEDVPPILKDKVLEAINAALEDGGFEELEARAF